MKRILIINTGGTISMVRTPEGYKPDRKSFSKLLHNMDLLKAEGMPQWDLAELDELIDSSNMTVAEWNKIGKIIADAYDKYDGFVVLHGTDTMAYTASALSFMLEHISKPVILTGSQIPLCEIRSDGRDNLITSLLIAASDMVHEVCIYFGNKLLRGNRSIKYSSVGLIAFQSPNYPALAEVGISISYNRAFLKEKDTEEFSCVPFKNIPIGVIKVFPGIQFEIFEPIMTEKLKGIVIETFGAGNIPGYSGALLPIIKKAFENGTIVTVCSQCPQGSVSLGEYEASMALKNAGAVSGYDITTEAAVAKLYYLFSKGYPADKIKILMEKNLCGEMKG
ncbi:MAG TPA: type I asparaginase [Clostridiaceae bacterium]|nr:type I asparaginase [Clostridiaceae bacterium]